MERYDQILYLSDLIAPNGEVWSNIVPQWPDSTKWRGMIKYYTSGPDSNKWRGMVKYCTSVTWYYQMERYDQILYLSDLIVPNGEVWSNIIPQWPDSNKWRGMSNIVPQWPDSTKWRGMDQILYLSDLRVVTKWRGMIKYCTSVTSNIVKYCTSVTW